MIQDKAKKPSQQNVDDKPRLKNISIRINPKVDGYNLNEIKSLIMKYQNDNDLDVTAFTLFIKTHVLFPFLDKIKAN